MGTRCSTRPLFTYALSVIEDFSTAYAQATGRLRAGGRVLVVDLALPAGKWRLLSPLARAACQVGGADWRRAPWTLLLDTTTRTTHTVLRGGHIHVAVGTWTTGTASDR